LKIDSIGTFIFTCKTTGYALRSKGFPKVDLTSFLLN
jgi:hypothetical protein